MSPHFLFIMLALIAGIDPASAQTATRLRTFAGGLNDGANPIGSLTLSNGKFYGLTSQGGLAGGGVLFKMKMNGSGYTNLYQEFTGRGGNGASPNSTPTLAGSNLYGTTTGGGVNGVGVVFREGTNGRGFTNLHVFGGGAGDGAYPYGSLTLMNGRLYGMSQHGGASDYGTLFRLGTNGGNSYTNLHEFAGGVADGAYPGGDLILSGTTFYGMTSEGGTADLGVVFKMSTNGSGYTNLHSFAGDPTEGAAPWGSLTLANGSLYGMTQYGGAANLGVVFKMNADGSSYTNLHTFAGGALDGATPFGSLALSESTLYGMTSVGGASNRGVVFQMNTDGTGYTNVYSFAGYPTDGASPWGSLTLSGSTLYGMTDYGGTNNDGVVFALLVVPPAPSASLSIFYSNNQAVVSWPSSASGWTLQTKADLAAGVWSNYTGTIIGNTVTNSPPKGDMFFRLRYP